jgi:ADP-ribose pyrophosphatase
MPDPSDFPIAQWDDLEVSFFPVPLPGDWGLPTFVVVFALHAAGFVLANVPERGWITPSGRLEPGETPLQAAIRETYEEIGAELDAPSEIGFYELRKPDGGTRYASAFIGSVTQFGDIPRGSESTGARVAKIKDLPGLYWRWDALLEAMFSFANSFRN